jgi:methylmalonyl-CoA mutase
MKKVDFKNRKLKFNSEASSYEQWKAKFKAETGKDVEEFIWETMEQINVNPLYTKDDLKDFEHIDYMSGLPPFLRGPYSTMYVARPWTVRQYAGFSTAEESNAFYRRNLAQVSGSYQLHSIWQLTADMIPIIIELLETLVKRVLQLTQLKI